MTIPTPRPAGRPSIVQERLMPAAPEVVFAAWSDAEAMAAWMCPGADMAASSVDLDFRVGGGFRIVMHGAEQDYPHRGEFLEIDPPKRLVLTWVSEWMPQDERETRVAVSFEPVGPDQTRLVLVHEHLPVGPSYDGHAEGWATILHKLAASLEQEEG